MSSMANDRAKPILRGLRDQHGWLPTKHTKDTSVPFACFVGHLLFPGVSHPGYNKSAFDRFEDERSSGSGGFLFRVFSVFRGPMIDPNGVSADFAEHRG